MNKKFNLSIIGVFIIILLLVIGTYLEFLITKDELNSVQLSQTQINALSKEINSNLGEMVTTIPHGKLGIEFGEIIPNVTAIRFYDRGKDNSINHPITLMCDARTQSLTVKHDLEYRDYADEYSISEFSIRHYVKGTEIVYTSDEDRIKPFSTNIGDRNLKEALVYITTLPKDDLISFAVEEPIQDSDFETFGSAYSPTYTVGEFIHLIKTVNLDDCIDVELKQKPKYDKQA